TWRTTRTRVDRSLVGISMSERLGLGVADAENRWIGIRRHQAVLVISGLVLLGEWVNQSGGWFLEVVSGVALLACATPTTGGLTVGERAVILGRFIVRLKWTSVSAVRLIDGVEVQAHAVTALRSYELQHRGRLDLSGRDVENASSLASFADGLATSDHTRHFSVHVVSTPARVTTMLALPTDVTVPAGWRENQQLAIDALGSLDREGNAWLLERWSYVRTANGLVRVLRVHDFSAVPHGRALLATLQFASPALDVTLHVDVLGSSRSHRLAARAVHRMGSDDVTSGAAGFRRTAASVRALERLRQREVMVVSGSALLRIAVYVVIRAATLVELARDVKAVQRYATESGLRCESGLGRQAPWYCGQLPGGPGW
ncbi:MAG: hypothetical protein ABI298_07645, partial [Acidimicrobiales bacterium]